MLLKLTLHFNGMCVVSSQWSQKEKGKRIHFTLMFAELLLCYSPLGLLCTTLETKKIVLDGLVCCCETFSSTTSHYSYSPLFVCTSKEAMLLMKAEMADKNNSNGILTLWPTT